MAVQVAQLSVKIDADTKDLESGLDRSEKQVNSFGGAASTVAKAGVGVLALGIGGLALGLGSSAGKAQDFEASLSGIQAVTGATGAQMDILSAKALQIGKDTSFSALDASAAIGELAKAGVSIPDIMGGAADATVSLAAAGGVSIPEAATLAANAMNTFHIPASGMVDVVNNIAGAANASAIDVGQFSFSLSAVGAVANLAGASFADTATAIAELGNSGLVGSDAGTSLKSFLTGLVPMTNKAQDEFRMLGLSTYDANKGLEYLAKNGFDMTGVTADNVLSKMAEFRYGISDVGKLSKNENKDLAALQAQIGMVGDAFHDNTGKLKPMSEVAEALKNSLKDLSPEAKQAALNIMFGSDGIRAAAIIADGGAEGFNNLAKSMNTVSAADVAATRLNNTKGSMEALKGSIETLQITIGQALLPGIRATIDGFTGFINVLIPLATTYFPMVMTAIAPFTAMIRDGIAVAFRVARDGIGTFVQALSGNWVESSGIMPIHAAIGNFGILVRDQIIPAVQRFVAGVIELGTAALPYIVQFGRAFMENVIPALVQVGKAGVEAFEKIVPVVRDQFLPAAAQLAQFLVTQVIPAIARLASFILSDVVPVIVDLYAKYITALVAGLTAMAGFIQKNVIPAIQELAQWFTQNVIPAITAFAGFVTGTVIPAIMSFVSFVTGNVGPALAAMVGWLTTNVLPALRQFGDFFGNTVVPLLRTFTDFIGQVIVPAIMTIVGTIVDNWPRIQTIITSVMDAVMNIVRAAWDTVSTVIDNALNIIKGFLDVFVGVFTGDWTRAWDGVKTILSSAWDAIKAIVSGASDVLGTVIRTAMDVISTILQAGWDAIKVVVDTAWTAIRGVVDTVWTAIKDAIGTAIGDVRDNISTVMNFVHDTIWQPIWDKVSGTVSTIWDGIKTGIQGAIEVVRDNISAVLNFIHDSIWQPIWDKVSGTTSTIWETIKTAITGAIESVRDGIRVTTDFIHDQIIEPVWNKIKGTIDTALGVGSGVQHIVSVAFDAVKSSIQTVMDEVHDRIIEPVWNKIKSTVDTVLGVASGVQHIVSVAFDAVKNGIQIVMNEVHDRIIEPIWTKIQNLFTNSKDTIKNAVMWPFEQARDAIGGVMDAFKSKMAAPFNTAAGGIESFIGGLRDAINWVAGKLSLGNIIEGSVSIPRFARGGVTPGGPIFAGEQGVELIMPPKGSRVFTAQETVDIFKAINGRKPEGAPMGPGGLGVGAGNPWDWAKGKVAGVTEAIAGTIRDFVGKGAKALLDMAMSALGVQSPGGNGALGTLGGGIGPVVKDAAIKGIQSLLDTIKDSIPAPPVAAGGGTPSNYPGGNAILDMALKTPGRYMWCEQFVGDVMERLGVGYHRAGSAEEHAHMQSLSPGTGPAGAVVFYPWQGVGHVNISGGDGSTFGTVPEGTGWRGPGAFGPPYGWTTNAAARNGAVFDEPMFGVGASGQRWTMAEDDAEILLNKGQASRAADALRGNQPITLNQTITGLLPGDVERETRKAFRRLALEGALR